MEKNKYVLNIGTNTLHIQNKCCHSKINNENDLNYKFYNFESDVIKENQNYIKRCKICFRDI